MEYRENGLSCQEYCRLRESVGWSNFPNSQIQQALRRSVYTVTALEGGRSAGMARLIGDGIYYTIVDVVVHPDFQQRGVGSRLVEMAVAAARRMTPAGGRCTVILIAAQGRESFYRRLGFEELPHPSCGPGMRQMIHSSQC